MPKKILGAAMLLMLMAGCNKQEPTAPATEASTSYEAQLQAMPEGQRNGVFIRAIRDAELACQHVERSTAQAPQNGMPVWQATCSDGSVWTIVIGPTGVAQILNPNEAAAMRTGAGKDTPGN